MIGGRTDSLAKPDIRNEKQVAIHFPAILRVPIQEHLHHRYHVATNFAAMLAP
jgi:hypothetical protein